MFGCAELITSCARTALLIVPVTLAPAILDNPPPSPVINPVVVIVFDPNAFNKVTTFESPYEPSPSMLIVEILPKVGVPETFA
jgi:hypothetical protein